MLIISIFFLLLSNAVTLRRDKSTQYNRVAILILLYTSFNGFICLFLPLENKGIPLYGGLFHATGLTQIFQISIFFACIMIIVLTALYPKRVLLVKHSFIEYPLVLLFIICSVVFLVSTSNIFIIYLSIILIVYALYILNSVYTYPKLNLLNFNSYFLLTGLIILWDIFRMLPLGLQLLILFRLFLYIYSGFSDVFQLNASSGPDDYWSTTLNTIISRGESSGSGGNSTPPAGNNLPPNIPPTGGEAAGANNNLYTSIKNKLLLQQRENAARSNTNNISSSSIYATIYTDQATLNSVEREGLADLVRNNPRDSIYRVVSKPTMTAGLNQDKVVTLGNRQITANRFCHDVCPSRAFLNYFTTVANV